MPEKWNIDRKVQKPPIKTFFEKKLLRFPVFGAKSVVRLKKKGITAILGLILPLGSELWFCKDTHFEDFFLYWFSGLFRTSECYYSASVILEPQIYVVEEQFGAENISLLSGRLVFFFVRPQNVWEWPTF